MTQTSGESSPSSPAPAKGSRAFSVVLIVMLLLALVVGDGLAVWCAQRWDAKITALESRTQNAAPVNEALYAKQEDLTKLAAKIESAKASQSSEVSDEDVAKLQADVKTLGAALADVQAQIKQMVQAKAKDNGVALAVAFTQLRAVAQTGAGFAPELQALRRAAGQDSTILAALARLEPFAATGAPSYATLHDDFDAYLNAALAATDQAEAQGWQDQMLAKLEGLISIRARHVNAGTSGLLNGMVLDVADHRLAAALDKEKQLPPAAQDVLRDWTAHVAERQNIEDSLNAIAAHLLDGEGAKP